MSLENGIGGDDDDAVVQSESRTCSCQGIMKRIVVVVVNS